MSGFTATPPGDLAVQRRRTKALQILGLDIRGTFTAEQIRATFRAIAKEVHPDAGGNLTCTEINDARHAKDFLLKQLGEDDG